MIAFIDDHRKAHGVEPICKVLPIAPSTYHARAAGRRDPAKLSARARRDVCLREKIQRVFDENFGVYGARKVWRQLIRQGETVARCTVERLMRAMGLQGVVRGKPLRTTVSDKAAPCPLDKVNRQFMADRLLHHGSGLTIKEHYTDTGGATDHVFALCHLLGFRFVPRLRDFQDYRLGAIGKATTYKGIESLLGRPIRIDVIREHWDEIIQLAASIKAGTVAPSVILKKLAAFARQNRLDFALSELGRIERTLFMLDWLESPDLRRRCHAGLNKGESRHALDQAVFLHKQGRIVDRTFENQSYRASGLNLVTAAIVYWNTVYLGRAVDYLRSTGKAVPDDLLQHVAPLGWNHISLTGDYLWSEVSIPSDGFRPLNILEEAA